MVRPFLNKSDDFTIGHDQTIHQLTQVKVPKFKKITYQVKMGIDDDRIQHYATDDMVTSIPTPKDMVVIKSEPYTVRLVNKCPTCHKEGRPRMAKRPNHTDYHVYKKFKPKSTGRRDSYFLVYDHKIDGKPSTHSIVRFDENHGFFTKRGKLSTILKDVMFPFCVKAMKNA